MNYVEYTFSAPSSDVQHDMLSALLGSIGFESFMDEIDRFKAYCPANVRDDTAVESLLLDAAFSGLQLLKVEELPDKDWNEVWEASYAPVVIDERCRVRAPFHEADASFKYDLVIEPKMSFGTANHETTAQMIKLMLDTDFKNKDVLDMGSGTAVLAILAKKLGAARVVAIDNDEWAYRNAFTNVDLNGMDDIAIVLGDAHAIGDGDTRYDVILANINRNILLRDMKYYVAALRPKGRIFFSGFFEEDLDSIAEAAQQSGLYLERKLIRNDWVAAVFVS